MNKKIMHSFLIFILFVFFIICHKPMVVSNDGPIDASNYIEDRGYKIIEYQGQREVIYTEKNINYSDLEIFMLMDSNLEDYMSKPLTFDKFVVTDHPLDNDLERLKNNILYRFETRFPNKTYIVVVSFQGKIIGGYSLPYETGAKLLGSSCRDIDGLSLTQHTNSSWRACSEILNKTYRRLKGR